MVWNHDETGELIDWYENIGLWGATAFNKKGKMGTVLAKTRETLVERALYQRGIPRSNALKHVRQIPGMEVISPVLLEGEARAIEILERYEIQAASDREPFYPPTEWLVTLLYEDRHMYCEHASPILPTVVQVLASLVERVRFFEECKDASTWCDEDRPYTVCEKEMHDLKALLGTAYPDFLIAFPKDQAVR